MIKFLGQHPHHRNPPVFSKKISVLLERGRYTVKTADSFYEVSQALNLRYQVFHREFQNKVIPFGSDWDELDLISDHLIIKDRNTDEVVGTYRLICNLFSNSFYSVNEFQCEAFALNPAVKVELSRAAIDSRYRNGITLSLLWKGITQYIQETSADYLFGCSSINTMEINSIFHLLGLLSEMNVALSQFSILPKEEYCRKNRIHFINQKKVTEIPPLLLSYLRAGAKVSLTPAWDYDFHCVDLFTLLNTHELKKNIKKRMSK